MIIRDPLSRTRGGPECALGDYGQASLGHVRAEETKMLTVQYSAEVVGRAANRIFANCEDPGVARGVYTLEFWVERIAADPEAYVQQEDFTDG